MGSVGGGFLGVAALLALVGYLIRFRRWAWLISGYNTSSKAAKARYDVVALTRGVGNFVFLLAAIMLVGGLGALVGVEWVPTAASVALAVACLVLIAYANTGGRYRKRP